MTGTMTRRGALALAAVIAMGLGAGGARAAETLKWAHVYETSSPYHTWALWAADEIGKRTEGRYAVEVFPASSLGKEVDINEGLTLGTLDIIYTGQLFAGRSYGPISIGGSPFMFRDFDHWAKFRDGALFKEMSEGYKKATGHHVITLTYYGQRHVTSNKEIKTPDDMKNLKIRVPNAPLYKMFPQAVGANPTPMAFAEVYLALQQGVVDAQENPLPTIQFKKFYEVQKYITLTGHITDALMTIVGGPTWDKFSDQDREIVVGVLHEAAANCTDAIIKAENELADWFRAQGVTVNEVDRSAFRKAVVPLHNGPDAEWDLATYEKLQAIK
ncbi:MAG: sialic acid TRAP transporter substrate-binding protein SiaP [Rhodospirillales bacterium]|nr:sialic acid TRAP transporter substrate-binding protein SiaP [Rhodospirillales bacterium]MDH3791562.1 sialic acid TRAP transporter substrate-binding protein SiaP [Rhodospirillales bacterium]MDH3911037.1 sialic acid TRAP transporter substrate-binding protein SiaP [Rhodospirillales bacterium]MDH3918694.1 sialic acid TRAP transporter substrate-binding protein SiaP [Rhodospirillales bacterium]MDH3967902.1 sialic acid TRAP transporter substrate-binding protein SiaP [Rhodospirillales bacterium]